MLARTSATKGAYAARFSARGSCGGMPHSWPPTPIGSGGAPMAAPVQ